MNQRNELRNEATAKLKKQLGFSYHVPHILSAFVRSITKRRKYDTQSLQLLCSQKM